jgi:phage terminase large subunit-like protein
VQTLDGLSGKVRIGDVEIDLARLNELSPGARLQARLALQKIAERRRVNPLLGYRVNGPKYARFHESFDPVKVIRGGNRSGKTTTAMVDDVIQVTPWELLPDALKPYKKWECPFYCRIMTPDLERTMKPVIWQKLEEWLPRPLLARGSVYDSIDKQAMCLRLECGCRFDFLSYEMALDKFGGAAMHRCHYDEEPPEDIRNEFLVRLADFDGDEVFSMTPLKGKTWFYRRIQKNAHQPGVTMVQVSTKDNPTLSQKAVSRIFDGGGATGLDATQARMRGDGDFTDAHGLVYPDVRKYTCQRPSPAAIQQAEEHVISVDPGIRICGIAMTARLGDRFVTYAAWELENADVEGYVTSVRHVAEQWGLKPHQWNHWILDPNNAAARNLVTGESVEDALIRLGISCEHGGGDLVQGVEYVRSLGDRGRWLIAEHLEVFLERLEDYPLKLSEATGQLVPAKNGLEHLCDSIRYGLTSRAWETDDDAEAQPVYPSDVARPPHWQPPGTTPHVGAAGDLV